MLKPTLRNVSRLVMSSGGNNLRRFRRTGASRSFPFCTLRANLASRAELNFRKHSPDMRRLPHSKNGPPRWEKRDD